MKHTSVSDLEHFLNNLSLEDVEKTDNLSDKDINEIYLFSNFFDGKSFFVHSYFSQKTVCEINYK